MTKYVIITIIMVAIVGGITFYFMRDVEKKTKRPEEPALATQERNIKGEKKNVTTKPKTKENAQKKEEGEEPATDKEAEPTSTTENGTEKPSASETKGAEKAKEIAEKLSKLLEAGIPKSEIDKVDLADLATASENAEKILVPTLTEKIAVDTIRNDALMDTGKFKESKLKEDETLAELPKTGEDKTLEDGSVITRKGEATISLKNAQGTEQEYDTDNFLLVSDKDGKFSFRIIEDAPKLIYSERLKLYTETLNVILGSKDKARQKLEEKMYNESDPTRKAHLFEAIKLLY